MSYAPSVSSTQPKNPNRAAASQTGRYARYWQRFEAINRSDCRPVERLVLHYLDGRAGCDRLAFPSQETIARSCRMHPKSIQRVLRDLRDTGVLVVVRRRSGNAYAFTDHFLADTPEAATAPPNAEHRAAVGNDAEVLSENEQNSPRRPVPLVHSAAAIAPTAEPPAHLAAAVVAPPVGGPEQFPSPSPNPSPSSSGDPGNATRAAAGDSQPARQTAGAVPNESGDSLNPQGENWSGEHAPADQTAAQPHELAAASPTVDFRSTVDRQTPGDSQPQRSQPLRCFDRSLEAILQQIRTTPSATLGEAAVVLGWFDDLVAGGLLHPGDRLRFFTLVRCRIREHRRRLILHPGSLIVRSLRLGQWPGQDADEAAARQQLADWDAADRPSRSPVAAEAIADVLAGSTVPG